MLTNKREKKIIQQTRRRERERKENKRGAWDFRSLPHSYGYILPTWWVDYSTNQPHCTQSNQAQWYAYLLLCNLYLIGRSGNLSLYTINVVYNMYNTVNVTQI